MPTHYIAYAPTRTELAAQEICDDLDIPCIVPRKVDGFRQGNRRWPDPIIRPLWPNVALLTLTDVQWHQLRRLPKPRFRGTFRMIDPREWERYVLPVIRRVEQDFQFRMEQIEAGHRIEEYEIGDILEMMGGPFIGQMLRFIGMVEAETQEADMAKRKRTAKGGASEPKSAVTLSCPSWDHGASGKANRTRLQVEERGDMDPNTGKIINPNGVTGVRRLSVAGLYHKRKLLTHRQFRAADTLLQTWEQKDRSPPAINEVKVDHSPKPDDRTAMVVDRAMAYVKITKHIPPQYARFINHVARDDLLISKMRDYSPLHMRWLRIGLDKMADNMGFG